MSDRLTDEAWRAMLASRAGAEQAGPRVGRARRQYKGGADLGQGRVQASRNARQLLAKPTIWLRVPAAITEHPDRKHLAGQKPMDKIADRDRKRHV
jgi:hypothetical protein